MFIVSIRVDFWSGILSNNSENETVKSEHELKALSFAQELIDKYEVFDEFVTNKTLDEYGIDILFIKRVGKTGRHLRFHIQCKPHEKEAREFRRLNPCIPTWVVNTKTSPHEALISILRVVAKKSSEQKSPYAKFFVEKLESIKKIYRAAYKF